MGASTAFDMLWCHDEEGPLVEDDGIENGKALLSMQCVGSQGGLVRTICSWAVTA
jgi:hypothetical protein